jgi:hypothetical protein
MTPLYLEDGTRILVPDDRVEAVLTASPSIKRLEDWSNDVNRHHPDFYAPENPGLAS